MAIAVKFDKARADYYLRCLATGQPIGAPLRHGNSRVLSAAFRPDGAHVVTAAGEEGRGIGRALMAAGEEWSRGRGHRLLTLNVFAANSRARSLYERIGYEPDTSKMVKVL